MKRLLIIEDDRLLATIYLKKLATTGLGARVAATGKAGLEQVASYRPHALLLDLMLPDISGLEILKTLRAAPATAGLPIIVFTNSFLPGPIQKARDAGATEVITKADCAVTQLIERIAACLAQSSYEPPAGAVEAAAPVVAAEIDPRQVFGQQAARLQAAVDRLLVIPSDMSRLADVAQAAQAIVGSAAAASEPTLAWMAAALEALVRDLFDKPKHRNPSSTSTIAAAARLVGDWLQGKAPIPARRPVDCRILAVDDDPIIGQLVSTALARAQLRCLTRQDPVAALETLRASPFDLILLDVEMPVMDGPTLCTELRKLPQHQGTPVVFVTAIGEFERRAASVASGGNDLLAKPFLPMELAVKALSHLLRRLSSEPSGSDLKI